MRIHAYSGRFIVTIVANFTLPKFMNPTTALVHKQVIGLDTQASLKEPLLNRLQSEASIAAGEEE